jgi:hypothetical protein
MQFEPPATLTLSRRILAIDLGGTNVKVKCTGSPEVRKLPSGPALTPADLVALVQGLTADWEYEVISLGYPGSVLHGIIAREPYHLGPGWTGYDFAAAFGKPIRILNDAALQALGSYEGGSMLFLGLGTGLGSALIVNGQVQPLELAHLPYRKGRTYEDYAGRQGRKRLGKQGWRDAVLRIVEVLRAGLQPDYVVLGGGEARKLGALPPYCRLGSNEHAFEGGFRLWTSGVQGYPDLPLAAAAPAF